jgi:hypothetical protein
MDIGFQVTLRVMGDALDPDHVTRLLGVSPDKGEKAGETWLTPKNVPVRARTGMWSRGVPRREASDINELLVELFAPLSADTSIWRELKKDFDIHVFCGVFILEPTGGFRLSSGAMQLLSERFVDLDFDMYLAHED